MLMCKCSGDTGGGALLLALVRQLRALWGMHSSLRTDEMWRPPEPIHTAQFKTRAAVHIASHHLLHLYPCNPNFMIQGDVRTSAAVSTSHLISCL